MSSAATDRLPRLLALVPWLLSHPDSRLADVAEEFGITVEDLNADLDLIWMCGLPGHGPGDLINVTRTADRVTLSNADTISAPLRLTSAETVAVIAAMRTLSTLPSIADTGAVDRALAKLEASAGSAADVADRVQVVDPPRTDSQQQTAATIREALTSGHRLRLDYWVPARDEVTTRDVDPIRIRSDTTATYLIGWCRLVDDVRTFRVDRVLAATMLDITAEVPAEAADAAALDQSLFTPSPSERLVVFELSRRGRWLIDYYPVESIEERVGGGAIVSMRADDDHWVIRLALGMAGEGRVIAPLTLAQSISALAATALAAYS